MNTPKRITAACIGLLMLSAIKTNAQNVQEGSVWAPAATRVDAKLTEWNNSLQAYNKTTLLYYTIANDDKNLYLAVKSSDQMNSNKIIGGGITFTINTEGKKKDKDAFVITYPKVNRAVTRGQFRQRGGGGGTPPDSASIANMRSQLLASAKEITLSGFKDITDSTISIYNEYGIKVAVGYDTNGSFIYELAVPLKLLNISPDNTKEIAYNLKVNALQFGNRNRDNGGGGNGEGGGGNGGGGFGGGRNGGGGFGGRGNGGGGRNGGGFGGGGGLNMADLMNATDFWGKYTLAKKPAQ